MMPLQLAQKHPKSNFSVVLIDLGWILASNLGVPGGTSNVVFGHVGAPGPPWGPKWLPDLAPRPSRPLQTFIFKDFRSILGGFLEDFGKLFVTMSCRTVTRVLAISRDFLGPLLAATHPHNPQPTILNPLLGTVAGIALWAVGYMYVYIYIYI